MNNRLFLPIAIIIAGVLVAGVIVYINISGRSVNSGDILSAEDAGQKLVNFINDNILAGQGTASLMESLEESGVYKVKFDVNGEEVEWRITKDGNFILPQVIDLKEFEELSSSQDQSTIGSFSVSSDEVCQEDGKPVVYFFGSESCPHCNWEHPIVKEMIAKFEGYISFHDNMDSDADMDIFEKYSTGGIPALVLGCTYYRVGSGENVGEEQETKNLTALVCKITDGQPGEVCSEIQDLINQI